MYTRLRALEEQIGTIEPIYKSPEILTLLRVGETTYFRKDGDLTLWNPKTKTDGKIVLVKTYLSIDDIPK